MGREQVQRRVNAKIKEDKKSEINDLTDKILEMRSSVDIVKHPDFMSWYKVNVGTKLYENLHILKTSKDHNTMLRAQGAVEILEGLEDWHENINKQIEKNRKRIEQLTKDIKND
jgi:hypothetical protein